MGNKALVALYALAMVAIIVGVDVLFLRNQFRTRLIVNIAIVLAFAAAYFTFQKRP
jgi:type IV secretory pathway VirB2 component (pilin)